MAKRTIFVSHAHADNTLCDRYVTALRDRGFDVWYDRSDLQAGSHLSADIQRELVGRSAFVVFLTPASVNSYWVRLETDAYRALMAQDETRMMLPVRLEPCDVPVLLEPLTWIDAIGKSPDENADTMARALETDPAARLPVPLARGNPRQRGRVVGLGVILAAVLCVVLLAAVLRSLGNGSGRVSLPFGSGGTTPTPGSIVITKDQDIPCDQAECGEPNFKLTLHTVTVDTDLHSVIMEWVITDKSTVGCPRLNLWDAALQDPHGNQIGGDSYGDSGGNFQVDSNQSVTRDKIYRSLPQLNTLYTFFMRMPTGCNLFGGDINGYTYTFTFTNSYRSVDVVHSLP